MTLMVSILTCNVDDIRFSWEFFSNCDSL